jgi:hypothetical protein
VPRPLVFVLALQCVLAVAGVAQSHSYAPKEEITNFLAELQQPVEEQDLPTQVLFWEIPRPMHGQAVPFYAEVIGNGTLAPEGLVAFEMAEKPFAIVPVVAITNKNYLRHSSQFDKSAWASPHKNSVLTPNYSISPLGDKAAYRFENVAEKAGNSISQDVSGLPGTQPVTFSVWIKANGHSNAFVDIMIVDPDQRRQEPAPCYLTSDWQRCSVTTPGNPTAVTVFIGSYETPWPWDVSIWGAQLEASSSPGVYIKTNDKPSVATVGLATFVTSCCIGSDPISATYGGERQQAAAEAVDVSHPACPDPAMRETTIGGNGIIGHVLQRHEKAVPNGKQKPLSSARVDVYSVTPFDGTAGLLVHSLSAEESHVVAVFTNEDGTFDSGVLAAGDYRLEVSGWGSATVHLNPDLGKDGFGAIYWVDLLDDGCIGAGQSGN